MTQEKQKKLVLIDGSSYLFRAYHVPGPDLRSPDHKPTKVVYFVLNMLSKLIKDEQPDKIAVVFDAKGKTFRNDIYPEYKANRPPMPDDLREQIEPLHDIIRARGLPLICIEGVEADDIIGTMSREAAEQDYQVLISTGDKDMAQLVNANVSLINTMNNHSMDEDGVVEKFQVRADQIVDYLALMGDSSDNIPGVPKVGPKTAAKWISEYGSLAGVIEHAEDFKGKVGEYLRESLGFLPMSYELATIKLDCETGIGIDELEQTSADHNLLADYYQKLGFNRWYDEIVADDNNGISAESEKPVKPDADYECLLEQTGFEAWLQRLRDVGEFAIDTETTSINYSQAELVVISISPQAGQASYIPISPR